MTAVVATWQIFAANGWASNLQNSGRYNQIIENINFSDLRFRFIEKAELWFGQVVALATSYDRYTIIGESIHYIISAKSKYKGTTILFSFSKSASLVGPVLDLIGEITNWYISNKTVPILNLQENNSYLIVQ